MNSARVGYFQLFFEIKILDPFWVDLELLSHEIGGNTTAVYRAIAPTSCKTNIMVTVEMTEEVPVATLHCTITKGIHAEGKTG